MKKKIIYSCAGEGRGHVTTVIGIAQYIKNDYDIIFMCPKTVSFLLREAFPDNRVIEIPGLTFIRVNGKINMSKTIQYAAKIMMSRARHVRQITSVMKEENVCAVINDFEPYTAYAANNLRIPLLHINHPGIILQRASFSPEILLGKLGSILIMFPGKQTLIYSFFDGDIGPVVRKQIKDLKPETGDHFLVYLSPDMKKNFLQIAKKFPQYDFRFFPNPEEDYLEAFRTCRAIIAPGGHQTMCEALILKKPMLCFPIPNQYEQMLNCKMLGYSGRGMIGNTKNPEKSFKEFLKWLENFPYEPKGHAKFRFEDDTEKAVKLVKDFIRTYTEEIHNEKEILI